VPLISIMVVLGAGAASSILTTVGGQGILESISRSLQGRRFCREDYRSVMAVLVAVLNDKAPALTGRVYPILYNTDVAQMIGDAKALLERHQISADHLGAVLQSRIDTIVTDQRRAVRILNAVRLSLLWFGALAFLLGAMRPLISLTEPPEVVGGMLAQALSAPLLGVFLAAGVFQPLARRIEAAITDDAHVYQVIRMAFYCRAAGSETELAVRAAFGSLPTEFSMDQSEFDAAAASV
jgi:chemotaxis protein MotA